VQSTGCVCVCVALWTGRRVCVCVQSTGCVCVCVQGTGCVIVHRAQDVAVRQRYVALVDGARDSGGVVRIFSSLHVSGEQLGQLSGVAAILRFPLPDPEDAADDDSSSDDER